MASVVKRPAPIPRWFWFASLLGCTPGFKRSRCKKLLKVTMSRIKLLRGRREVQVRQLRRDVAQLLQLGQVENAENRLDRLWKEQSLLSAYTKTGEFCQLVKANLSNIALPRECPVDLKEPIASLCFAASCCADLPELQEFREIMVLKYGRDSLLAAHELLPGKHVNKTFLEAFATKEQSEMSRKILLKGILKEYNIVQPKKPHSSQKQQLKTENCPFADDHNQHHSLLALEKEEKLKSARQTLSKPLSEGLNGELTVNGETKNRGQHKLDWKNGQLGEGTTECGRDRSRSRDHKRTTIADQSGEGDHYPCNNRRPANESLEPVCTVANERYGLLLGQDNIKGHPRSKGKALDKKVRSQKEVNDSARMQHERGEAPPLRDAYEHVHGEGRNIDPKVQHQRPCNESLPQGFKPLYMQQKRDLCYEEEMNVERDVYSRSNGYSRSKRVMHDIEKTQCNKGMPHSDFDHVKPSSKRHIRSTRRSAGECHDEQQITSFHSHARQSDESRTGFEFEVQQLSLRDNGSLAEQKDTQKVMQERKHSSKKSLHNEVADIKALSEAYPNAHESQKGRKKHGNKHRYADIQQEIATDFSGELWPDQMAEVAPPLHKAYEDYEHQLKETTKQTCRNLNKMLNHATKAEAETKTEMATNYSGHAIEPCVDEGHVPQSSSIPAWRKLSRRTKKHNLDLVSSRRELLNGSPVVNDSLQGTFAEENAHSKASLPDHRKGSSTLENKSTQRERGHFLEPVVQMRLERGFKVANGYDGYGNNEVHGVQIKETQLDNSEDYEGREVKEREKDTLLSSRFSKPPDRPPPPIPPPRTSSLPSRQQPNPPVLPQRCVTLETSHVRGIQEPHVHPKLPEYEDLVASFAALRNKSHSLSSR